MTPQSGSVPDRAKKEAEVTNPMPFGIKRRWNLTEVWKKRLREWEQAPSAQLAHPREEHLIPLMVVVGAAEGEAATRVYHEDDFLGDITASSYRFG